MSEISLDTIEKGKYVKPWITLVYGPEKIGKTTFAADSESPIFLDTQDGSFNHAVDRWAVKSWEDILEAVKVLTEKDHAYKTLVIDTISDVEAFLWNHICRKERKKSIEKCCGGYSRGYNVAVELWRVLLNDIKIMQREKEINVLLIGHKGINKYSNPSGPDYDKYDIKLHKKASELFRELSDNLLFADFKVFVQKDEKEKAKAFGGEERILYTVGKAAFNAGNRHNLPPEMPMSWDAFIAAMKPKTKEELREEIKAKAELIDEEKVHMWVGTNIDTADHALLTRVNNKLAAKLSEGDE